MNSKRKPIPPFRSEDEERQFWATHDSAALKTLANKRDVPYQSLVKMFLAEKVREETAQQHVQPEPK